LRRRIVLLLALATSSARGQGAGLQYYYSPNPGDGCSVDADRPCSIVECDAVGKQCACPLVLPNGWKRPLTKEQCEWASRSLPLYRSDEVDRRLGFERRKGEATASSAPKDDSKPLDPKDIVSPRSEAARKLPDDQLCDSVASGGGGTRKHPTTCTYNCGMVLVCVEVDPPAVCPGEQGGTSKARWKEIKGLRPCKSKP